MKKDIEELFKEYINNIFLDKKMHLTPIAFITIILFAIFSPFHIIYLKIKNIFTRKEIFK